MLFCGGMSEKMEVSRMEEGKKKKGKFIRKHPFLAAVLLSAGLGMCYAAVNNVGMMIDVFGGASRIGIGNFFGLAFLSAIVLGGFLFFPLVLTAAEIYLLVAGRRDHELYRKGRIFDIVGVILGILYSMLYLNVLGEVVFGKDWEEQLENWQRHTPIYTKARLTVVAVVLVAAVGYFAVNFIPLKKMPPLVLVLGFAAMYLGTLEGWVWGIQVLRLKYLDCLLLLPPINCTILTARTVSHKMWEWNQQNNKCNRFLEKSERWPLAAFLLMWPLLGILIGILILFGQKPDAVIKAFTETSDWNLSQRVAPQNVYFDEHYLCTVAAGGHEKIVKPRRLGVRHGHQVIVNRQLCVANAFEQVLEERTPRFHRALRHFYDTYGFPVAKLIRSKYTADLIYILMKPLEWLFLIVLYLTDVNPENRIAIQYTGKSLKDFE